MKKILVVTNHMNVGGIQKSLLELLKALANEDEYDVSLFCCKKTGAFLDQIPNSVTILPENPYAALSEQPLIECKKQGKRYYLTRMLSSLWSKWFNKALPARFLCGRIGQIGDEYDIAISYSQPIGDHAFCSLTNEIVLHCVRAKRKVTFVHCDFANYGGNTKRNRGLYRKFDAVAAVSDSVKNRFAQIVPEMSERLYTVYNFCDCEEIRSLAQVEPIVYEKPTVVTVARLSEEKGLLRCIPLFERLKSEGYEFEWHIVGGGPLRAAIQTEIEKYHLEQTVILEGEQINPYRYVRNADYFLLCSFHEAAPMVFDEAATLMVPILSTKTLSAVEMVEKRGIGVVCENDAESIYRMLKDALSHHPTFEMAYLPQKEICMAQLKQMMEQ
ncbi:MAG: glycosyltransferase [Clostridia bacterium]|nr:glycosyltransferase [Clostridia bacterium]